MVSNFWTILQILASKSFTDLTVEISRSQLAVAPWTKKARGAIYRQTSSISDREDYGCSIFLTLPLKCPKLKFSALNFAFLD